MTNVLQVVHAIQSWLLGPEVQYVDGPHCGGVIGWFDDHGSPKFIYPEITGYYLSWLAFWANLSGQSDEAAHRANLALSWTAKYFSGSTPPKTRIYLLKEEDRDWRNSGSFSFDLAMLTRGVASVRNLAEEDSRNLVLGQLCEHLIPFCDKKGTLQAFRPHVSDVSYPLSHWSCIQGPYQAKAAAAILSSNSVSPIPPLVHQTAHSVYTNWRSHVRKPASDNAHAALYHLEGLALAAANGWDSHAQILIENLFMQILGMIEPPERSDVLAQALRIGCMLCSMSNGINLALTDRLRRLAEELEKFLAADGSILFSRSPNFRHRNVWSSIFAHQALCFYEVIASGNNISNHWLKLLI